ncbi:LysR family transcriptional regulator [uncultured Oscillibacter sp.]|uniref:LysR family transcriptional regulator n=1 Tax=uncultured Oscillibacter sp. TaxID=876091 RepID=UPI0025F746BD|nr:LysR family transcriptional regulator [uncultured Oscillibacter sp.]
MTIDNLECFVTLAQELSFTKAAERANISQTAISRKIASVENELQVSLFLRNHHKVELTNAGREFYNKTVRMLQEYQNSVVQAQNVQKGVRDTIQVGFGVYEHVLLQPVIQQFFRKYPVPRINCLQYKYKELLDELMRDHIDIIVSSDQFIATVPRDKLVLALLHDRPWVLALNKDNKLAANDVINLAALENENVITMHEGSISTVRSAFRGMVPFCSIDYVNSFEAKLMLINAARGVGFIPSFVDTSRYENIVTRGVDPLYRPRRYYAIYKKENSNPHTQVLFNMLASYYEGTLWMPKVFY